MKGVLYLERNNIEKKKKSNVFSKVSKNSSTGFILFITVVVLMFLGFIKAFTSSNTSNKNALNKTGVIKFSGNEKISFDDEYYNEQNESMVKNMVKASIYSTNKSIFGRTCDESRKTGTRIW